LSIHRDRIIKNKYDVIVIGAGLGGLTTASLLAKRGIDVLVIEQHTLPGGACTSFRREGRVFDSGAALIFGLGKSGYNLISTLINLLEEEIAVIPREKFFRLDFAGQSINFWKDLDKFIPELVDNFPEDKKQIHELYKELLDTYRKYLEGQNIVTPPTEMSDREKMGMLLNPLRVLKLRRLLNQSAKQYMGKYIKSQKLLNFYDKLCASYAYITMEEAPAIMAVTMFTDNHIGGTHYVAKSAQTYSNTLERSIERNGGTIIYERLVDKILFKEGKVAGVKLNDGFNIYADRVVSDTTVWNLYNKLIPENLVTDEQRNWVDSLAPTYPAMVLYAAVSKQVFPSDINPVEYYISDPKNIDMNDITLYIPSLDDSSLGPSDEHIITIFSPSPNIDWPRPWENEYGTKDYIERKQERASLIIDEIDKRIPGFSQGIRKLIIATPTTIERYTRKNHGCVGGPKQMIGQELENRLRARTDWPNLYACGDSTTMGMGVPAVTASGFGAANIILRDLGKQEHRIDDVDKNFVNYIDSQPPLISPKKIDDKQENASLLARECQHCENQPCRINCPVRLDIAGILRRIEAENYVGAASLIHETNPFPVVCGIIENSNSCEEACIRTEFADNPVRIKELITWVDRYVGLDGWSKPVADSNGESVCIIGAGPEGLTCAYYLSKLGYTVHVFDTRENPGGVFLDLIDQGRLDKSVFELNLKGVMQHNIGFTGGLKNKDIDLGELTSKSVAVYISVKMDSNLELDGYVSENTILIKEEQIYELNDSEHSLCHAISIGRKAAFQIQDRLNRRNAVHESLQK